MRKIKKIILKLRTASFKFNLPSKRKIIIFDDQSFQDLKYVVKEYDYFLLQTRFDTVSILYVNPLIFFKTLINYRGNLWTAYIVSLIEIVSPKIVLTFIDNSLKFFDVAKIMNNKANFFAIQNGARYDLNRYKFKFHKKLLKKDVTKRFFIPNFFCFGQYEIDDYKKKNINVANFFPVGSLRLANFILEKKINLSQKLENKYDILLISDAITLDVDKNFGTDGALHEMAKFIKYVIKYSLEKKKSIIISLKRLNSSSDNLEEELKFYKKYLNSFEYDFFINNSTLKFKKSKYLTYELMLQSNIAISCFSTLLRENLSIGRKTLSVNFMSNDIFEFPLEGICKIKSCSYQEFDNRLDELFQISDSEFLKKLDGKNNYLMSYNKNISAIESIKKIINSHLS